MASSQRAGLPIRIADATVSGCSTGAPSTSGAEPAVERGTGEMRVNGAAARLVQRGDTIIVISYAQYGREEADRHEPIVVHVHAKTNRIIDVDNQVATLLTVAEAN